MSSTLLFSNSIEGAWTIDKAKAEQLFNTANNEMEQFIISMMTTTMMDIEFKANGSCKITSKNRTKCWEKQNNNYLLYEEDGRDGGVVNIIDSNRIELALGDGDKLKFEFTRVDVASRAMPSIVMKKDSVYHAKNVKNDIFEKTGDAFLMFTGEDDYYNLFSDGFSSFTVNALKAVIKKDKSDNGGFLLKKGAYSVESGQYKIKNNGFYTVLGESQIEVITPEHIIFNGYDYYLDE
jgi:hypothetical protein